MPYYGYYGMNMSYLIWMIPALIITLIAQMLVKSTYARYKKVATASGYTGADVARRILSANGVNDVMIAQTTGNLTDHFDPRMKTISLSPDVYCGRTISAAGIAAHEVGHALQYAQDYGPIKLRAAIIPVTNIGSRLSFPLILIGYLLSFYPLVIVGICFYSLAVVFQLMTLPVEFNASRRALRALEDGGLLAHSEVGGARKVLNSAAMTYVAALVVSLAQLLRLIMIFGGRRRND